MSHQTYIKDEPLKSTLPFIYSYRIRSQATDNYRRPKTRSITEKCSPKFIVNRIAEYETISGWVKEG